jgi:hypothetical protein
MTTPAKIEPHDRRVRVFPRYASVGVMPVVAWFAIVSPVEIECVVAVRAARIA